MKVEDAYWMQQRLLAFDSSHEALEASFVQAKAFGYDTASAKNAAESGVKADLEAVATAGLYHVTADADRLITAAIASMPAGVFHADDLPVPAGLIVWESPPLYECRWDDHGDEPISVLTWGVGEYSHSPDGPIDLLTGVHIRMFTEGPLERATENHAWNQSIHPTSAFIAICEQQEFDDFQWFAAFCAFVRQELLRVERHHAPRSARRDAERHRVPEPLVNVVKLRRVYQPTGTTQSADVEWSHRWMVGGHWRNQWYPSVRGHRRKWIMPYVKGPPDKPFELPKPTVFDVSR